MENVSSGDLEEKYLLEKELGKLMESTLRMENEIYLMMQESP